MTEHVSLQSAKSDLPTDAHGGVWRGLVAIGTGAAVTPLQVNALPRVADVGVLHTLVTVCPRGEEDKGQKSRVSQPDGSPKLLQRMARP